jgi:uncharacterized repeat protein (TIGR03803 family)
MDRRKQSLFFVALLVAGAIALPHQSTAETEKLLHVFNGRQSNTPYQPMGNLVFDAAGNLYGTAAEGAGTKTEICGEFGCGAVYEMSPKADGSWQTKILYRFLPTLTTGYYPVAGVILDAAGNLYSTAEYGGAGTTCGILTGFGIVYELSPAADGSWTYKILHSFGTESNCADGAFPEGALVFDAAGNLYGTTEAGGANYVGTVFKLSPNADGGWTETVLHSFNNYDGSYPRSTLIFDSAGNLYGTTSSGSPENLGGTVFELSPASNGTWNETALYRFKTLGSGGYHPVGGVIFDAAGNLYGTDLLGGTGKGFCDAGCGTVFELMPTGSGAWTRKTLHTFSDNGVDGYAPYAGLTFDSSGNLFGTASLGGPSNLNCEFGCGVLYELQPSADGEWTEKLLHQFGSYEYDGTIPMAGVILDSAGNLYGTTSDGGRKLGGTVFEFIP